MTGQSPEPLRLVPGIPGSRWILTGGIQSGKTSYLERLLDQWRHAPARWHVGGLVSPGVFLGGRKVACRGCDCLTGECFLLGVRHELSADARHLLEREFGLHCGRGSGQSVGSWLILDHGLGRAAEAIAQAVANRCDLVVVDEFGPLELGGKGLRVVVDHAVESGVPILLIVRETLVERVQKLYGRFTVFDVPPVP